MKQIWLIVQIKLLSDKKQMSVQHKKNFSKLDNQDHILVKKGVAAVTGRFLETRKVRLRDGKVFFLFIRILFFSKNPTYFVIDLLVDKKEEQVYIKSLFSQPQKVVLPGVPEIIVFNKFDRSLGLFSL